MFYEKITGDVLFKIDYLMIIDQLIAIEFMWSKQVSGKQTSINTCYPQPTHPPLTAHV